MVATIEQLAQDEMIAKRTRDLFDTDFDSTLHLLTDKHFAIAKTCANETDAKLNCWKTTATGKDKVTYKNLDKRTANPNVTKSVVLKNGVLLNYRRSTVYNGDKIGAFYMDINGNEKPNIGGRDLFLFYIDSKGHIHDISIHYSETYTLEQKTASCKTNYMWCFGALADNGWKMDY